MDKVWIVEGATGEYSDHYEWPVCFYETEAEAQAMVNEILFSFVVLVATFILMWWAT